MTARVGNGQEIGRFEITDKGFARTFLLPWGSTTRIQTGFANMVHAPHAWWWAGSRCIAPPRSWESPAQASSRPNRNRVQIIQDPLTSTGGCYLESACAQRQHPVPRMQVQAPLYQNIKLGIAARIFIGCVAWELSYLIRLIMHRHSERSFSLTSMQSTEVAALTNLSFWLTEAWRQQANRYFLA